MAFNSNQVMTRYQIVKTNRVKENKIEGRKNSKFLPFNEK